MHAAASCRGADAASCCGADAASGGGASCRGAASASCRGGAEAWSGGADPASCRSCDADGPSWPGPDAAPWCSAVVAVAGSGCAVVTGGGDSAVAGKAAVQPCTPGSRGAGQGDGRHVQRAGAGRGFRTEDSPAEVAPGAVADHDGVPGQPACGRALHPNRDREPGSCDDGGRRSPDGDARRMSRPRLAGHRGAPRRALSPLGEGAGNGAPRTATLAGCGICASSVAVALPVRRSRRSPPRRGPRCGRRRGSGPGRAARTRPATRRRSRGRG